MNKNRVDIIKKSIQTAFSIVALIIFIFIVLMIIRVAISYTG